MQEGKKGNTEFVGCQHKDLQQTANYFVCKDCGLIIDEEMAFEKNINLGSLYSEAQREYERKISSLDQKAKQDPNIAHKYQKIKTLEKWFRDYQTSFHQQKKTIELLRSYDFNVSPTDFQDIKKKYLNFNKNHRKTYQNMVIIFLAIVWMQIKEITNKRIEQFITSCNEMGHKISKKMLNNAMEKVKRTKKKHKVTDTSQIEKAIKNKIKMLLDKDLNNIPFEKHAEIIPNREKFDELKIAMLLLASDLLEKISYENIQSLNYKAFTAGFIYFLGQTLDKDKRRLFTQSIIEEATTFSSTTIRKKFHILKELLGEPKVYRKG